MLGTQVLHKQPATTRTAAARHRRWLWALPLPLIATCLVVALIGARNSTPDAGAQARTAQGEASTQVDNAATVPDVVGIPLEEALRRLAQAGLTGAARASVPSDLPPGTVVQTVPNEGQPLPPGAQVTIQTSAGPASGTTSTPVNVPDVRGLSLDAARRRLEQAGFAVVTGEQVPSDQPAGTVIATVPDSDQPLARGMQVVVHASAGPVEDTAAAPVAVPNVLGLALEAAQRQIEQAELVCVVDVLVPSDQPAGTVVSILPAPGTPLPPGTRVVVHASAGPATPPAVPTASPRPTGVLVQPTTGPTATPAAPVKAPGGPPPPVQPTQPQPVLPTRTTVPVAPTATVALPTSVPPTPLPPEAVPSTPPPQPTEPQPVPAPPTSTPVPVLPTDTPAPVVPTDTPVPVPTDTPVPAAPTDTPVPPATPTPEDDDDDDDVATPTPTPEDDDDDDDVATPTTTGDDDHKRNDAKRDITVTPPSSSDDERGIPTSTVGDEDDR